MHNRNVLIVLPILFFIILEIRKDRKNILAHAGKFGLGFGIPILLLVLYFYRLYGVLTPLGAHNEPFTSLFRLGHFWDGFFGLLLDQECGLWFHFPIFALAVTGGTLLFRSDNSLKHLMLGTILFYFLFMCFYENLGLTPAARYWVGVVPLLLPMVYFAVDKMDKGDWWTRLAVFFLAVGGFVNWLLAAVPWMRYNKLDGENAILKTAGSILHLPFTSWEPAFQAPVVEMKTYWMSAFWVVATVFLTWLFLREKTDGGNN
jgi:hypothetical protein